MRLRVPLIISAILIVGMGGVSLWAVMGLPAGTQVAIHWGPGGVPNNFASVPVAVSTGPLIALVLSVVFAILMRFATIVQADGMPNLGARLLLIVWIAAVVVIAWGHATIVYGAMSHAHGPI
jgi:hypothetical protein